MQITRMAVLRWRIVQAVDFIDARIIGHRVYAICQWCGGTDWWEAGDHQPGASCPVDWDRYREYAPYPYDPIDQFDEPRSLWCRMASWVRRG